tara:strand:+ start:1486 stop:3783 length:2298 start_codon:yes stop_codon:yes gene_type:complete
MKGFIIYPSYKNIQGKSHIILYGRLENGESFVAIKKYSPYFFIKEKDAKKLKDKDYEKTNLSTFNGKKVSKLSFSTPAELKEFRDSMGEGIDTYEAEVRYPYRYLMDKNIHMAIDIDGEYDVSHENVDRVYLEPEIKSTNYVPNNLKVLSIDIETSSDGKDLYCIGLYSKDYKKVFLKSNKKIKEAISFKTEEEVLNAFREEILSFDPDIITGWNLIDFDFKYLRDKFKKYEIPFNLNRDNSVSKLRIEKDFFRASKADFEGRVVLDGIELMKTSFIKLENYKLNTAAKKVLGKSKLIEDVGKEKYDQIDKLYKKNLKKLVDYNMMDCILVYDILYKGTLLDLTIQRSLITGMPLDRVSASIASLDMLYLPEARKKKLVCPTSVFKIKEKPITGGYVMESKPGIYDNTLILDFKSLYPSIIRTFNIDPSSYSSKIRRNSIKTPANVYFKKEIGVLPSIIQTLWEHREKARKDKNELARWAIKILMNSFFGVLANQNCRFFNPKIANSITLFGQDILKRTKNFLEKEGCEVIYQDTDSSFINSNIENYNQASELGEELEKKINLEFDKFVNKKYGLKSFLEMEFEKCYIRFLMPRVRSGTAGAKKRYAGLMKKDGKEEIQFVGLEVMRSDWTEAAKEFQQKLFDKIFHKEDPTKFIKEYVKDIQNGKIDTKLVYTKSLRKRPEEYTKTTPPHVKAARKLKEIKSSKIEYLITMEGPEPKENLVHRIDYKHYIDKQIKPIANAILEFYGISFEEVIEGKKQKSLFEF